MLSKKTTAETKASIGLLVLRLVFSLSMLFAHGWGKLMRFGADEIKFSDPLGIGVIPSLILATFAEVFCSIFVALGLFTRETLIPLIITMAVALFIVHSDDPFGKQEKALLFLTGFVALFFTGPGKYSLDSMFRK